MAKSPSQRLLLEAMASLQKGRRTVEFERLLLSFFPAKDRGIIREALGQKAAFSATNIRLAHAAQRLIETKNQFESVEDALKFTAEICGVHTSTLRRAALERRNGEVNQLLRELRSTPKN